MRGFYLQPVIRGFHARVKWFGARVSVYAGEKQVLEVSGCWFLMTNGEPRIMQRASTQVSTPGGAGRRMEKTKGEEEVSGCDQTRDALGLVR
jgi:hypothetical protein